MSIFEDYTAKSLSLRDIVSTVESMGLGTYEQGYIHGFMAAYASTNGGYVRGGDLEKILDHFRDKQGDGVESYEADKVREKLEELFKTENNLT